MGQSASKEGRRLSQAIRRQDAQEVFRITATFPEVCADYRTFWRKKTLLMIAAESDNILAVSTILWACEQTLGPGYHPYLNDASSSGNTALILATRSGNESILRLLLEEGATVLPANRRGQAAVHTAAHRGYTACLELILDAPIRSTLAGGVGIGGGGARIAAMASVHDNAGESRYIDAHDRAGFSALHLATITRSSSAVTALVERGATLDSPILRGIERLPFLCGGSTPLHIAAAQGDARTCLILLDGQWRHSGLELRRIRNMLGLTPLNCALLGGHHDVVRILLESGSRTTRGGRRGGGGGGGAAANGLGDTLRSSAASSLHRMVPLSASFPDSLREHMLAVLQRAALLLQLREIAGEWRADGAAHPTDTLIVTNLPLLSLNLSQINGLKSLLSSRETSLKDFLYGLELTLRGSRITSRRIRRRNRQRDAAAGAAVTAAAATDEGATAGRAETEARTIAELASPCSSDDGLEEEEEGSIERHQNDLELALHEISGAAAAAGETSINENESATPQPARSGVAGGDDHRQQLAANNQDEVKSPPALPAVVLDEDCSICMDARTEISFIPCAHSLCFQCAYRLCARGTDAATCPFCRQPVEAVTALAGARSCLTKEKDESSAPAGGVSAAAVAAAVS